MPIHWHHPSGPHFGNMVALLIFDGGLPRVRLEKAVQTAATDEREAETGLELIEDLSLTRTPRVPQKAAAQRTR